MVMRLVGEHRKVETAQACGVGDDVDLGDAAIGDGEVESAMEASARRPDESDGSVDNGGMNIARHFREGDGSAGPVGGTADLARSAGTRGGFVDADEDIGIENSEERVEVSAAQSGEKCI